MNTQNTTCAESGKWELSSSWQICLASVEKYVFTYLYVFYEYNVNKWNINKCHNNYFVRYSSSHFLFKAKMLFANVGENLYYNKLSHEAFACVEWNETFSDEGMKVVSELNLHTNQR